MVFSPNVLKHFGQILLTITSAWWSTMFRGGVKDGPGQYLINKCWYPPSSLLTFVDAKH